MNNYKDDGERERYIEGMNPLRRYFNDIGYKSGHFGDLLIAADKLVEEYFGSSQETGEMILARSEVFPSESAFNKLSERELGERLVTFPLEDIAKAVEKSDNLVEIKDWYEFLINKIKSNTSKDHQNGCLISVGHGDGFRSCSSSMFCPWHYTAFQLRKDVIRPDFSSIDYRTRPPNILAAIAEFKLKLSVEYGLTQQDHADSLRRIYWNKHFESIGTIDSMF